MDGGRPLRTRGRPDPAALQALAGIDPLIAKIYALRGVRDSDQLDYGLSRLAPVGKLDNVDAAADILLSKRSEKIVVVGDFDADGATSTALFLRCLRDFGFADVSYLVPNRFEFGYGLSPEIVRVAAGDQPALIVTVDNGISSVGGVATAKDLGIDVLVTDHHLPGSVLPDAAVIVNPNLPESRFPSRNLAGVGVAFYVLASLGRRLEQEGLRGAAAIPARYLDLVALGTIADVVPLDHNNRILVEQGLRRIRAGRCVPGITALLDVSGREPQRLVSSDLGFALGPRLNAAGRLEDMGIGIEALLTDDPGAAGRHAETLDAINRERRRIETNMRDEAFDFVARLDPRRLPACICVYERSWHQGVVGLIAARVRERWHRPVVAFARDRDAQLKGSVRSVPGVHARDLIDCVASRHPGLVGKYGGHAMAAGLTLAEDRYQEFAAASAACLAELYPDADFSGAILTDGVLPPATLTLDFARALRAAGPWGAGFPEPLWQGDFTIEEQRTVGEKHLKMRVRPVDGDRSIDAIAFNHGGTPPRGTARMAFRLDINEFRGRETAQLIVEQVTDLESTRRSHW
jgi:single-stranded-DNA-specific exonuclease